MRIIGGQFKGRKFIPPAKNWPTRPTTDYAKEALFNILANRIDLVETVALDLFGGTGNHCYELISRGSSDVTYVDQHHGCYRFAKKICAELNLGEQLKIYRMDVFKFIKSTGKKFDYIFADPPYAMKQLGTLPDFVFQKELLNEDGLFVLEHDNQNDFNDHPRFTETRKYGKSIFTFFE